MHVTRSNRLYWAAMLWISSIQYYVIQVLVAMSWQGTKGFSVSNNTISDLGNTACGQYGSRFVCSPQHALMNGSFIILGLTMLVGSYVLNKNLITQLHTKLGFISLGLAGIGTVMVGLYPENTVALLHAGGAALPFVVGNLGLVFLGTALHVLPRWLRILATSSGVLALLALPLFITGQTAFLGNGGWERVVAYPQSMWMIITGLYLVLHPKIRRG